MKLTQEGRSLYERTGTLLTELDETVAAIASGGDKPRGKLRISAPCCFHRSPWAGWPLGSRCKYPEVRLEITTEDRPVDMVEEGYDLVIRIDPDPDESLVGRDLSARSAGSRCEFKVWLGRPTRLSQPLCVEQAARSHPGT